MKIIIDLSQDEIDLLVLAIADESGDTLREWHGELQYMAEKVRDAKKPPALVKYIVPKTTG